MDKIFAGYSDALARENWKEAYQYCRTGFRDATSYDQFSKEQRELVSQFGKLQSAEAIREDIEYGFATSARNILSGNQCATLARSLQFGLIV